VLDSVVLCASNHEIRVYATLFPLLFFPVVPLLIYLLEMPTEEDPAAKAQETTPLLPREQLIPTKQSKSVFYRALIVGFMVSISFGVTQVP
jgi:hypothetical protein